MLRQTIAMTFSAVSVLALAACGSNTAVPAATGSAAASSQQAPATSAPAAAATSVAPAAAPSDSLSAALAAIATAEKAVGGIAVSIDDEDDDKSWEVDVQTENRRVEVKVSGDGATVLKQENEDHEADEWAAVSGAKVRIADAMKAAMAHTPGRFDDADLDDENNSRHHWEVSVYPQGSNDSIDLDVDLGTGQVSKR
ncbi:MAG: PepSY domain-containing protein [Propionibacteriaceae bacterium]|nr:PepSY domain-containing protein [Propionibacteriaceae bacterium]